MDFEIPGAGNRGQVGIEVPKHNLRRSCEVCRASKGRCYPSIQDSKRCQKCVRDGKECVFLEPMPRPKRAKTSRRRVADLEQKLDGLIAMLSPEEQVVAGKEISLSFPASQKSSTFKVQPELIPSRIPIDNFSNVMPGFSALWKDFDDLQDVISCGVITINEAERCLAYYKCHIQNFPFVIIQPHVSLDHLRRERPFVLLSILAMASRWNLQLQRRLETELRETLGRRVVINGEKSMDLLQGLLLYLAWYHYYYESHRQQSYQLSQMVMAMAMELGISKHDQKWKNISLGPFVGNHLEITRPNVRPLETEDKRTFLGCFYLCSCISMQFRLPSNLKYTEYIDECCKVLVKTNEFDTDNVIPYLIRLQHLAEEVRCAFDYSGYQQLPELDAIRTEALVKTFTRQLNEMKDYFPAVAWENNAIMASFRSLKIYINEIGMHATPPYPQDFQSQQGANLTWYYSMARTNTLINCLEATKEYMEFYLTLSPEQLYLNTMSEEIRMAYAFLNLGKFTSGVNSPHVDPMQLRKSANLSYYMDALIARVGEKVITTNGKVLTHYLWQLRPVLSQVKEWYAEQINGGYFTTLGDSGIPSCHDMAAVAALELEAPDLHHTDSQSPCRELSPDTPDAPEIPLLDNVLTDLPENWPTCLDPQDVLLNKGGYY